MRFWFLTGGRLTGFTFATPPPPPTSKVWRRLCTQIRESKFVTFYSKILRNVEDIDV